MNSINSGNVTKKTIEFTKYLNCPDCRASGLYCTQHRIEVDEILEQDDGFVCRDCHNLILSLKSELVFWI